MKKLFFILTLFFSYNSNSQTANDYANAANEKFNNKDWEEAITFFSKAIEELEKQPGGLRSTLDMSVSMLSFRATSKQNIDDYYGAISDYSRAIELKPDEAYRYSLRGYSKYLLKDYNGSLVDYDKAIELEPNSDSFFDRASTRIYLKDYYGAISDLTRGLELYKPYYSINSKDVYYNNRGYSKQKLKDMKAACEDYKIAAELGNKNSQNSLNKLCN